VKYSVASSSEFKIKKSLRTYKNKSKKGFDNPTLTKKGSQNNGYTEVS